VGSGFFSFSLLFSSGLIPQLRLFGSCLLFEVITLDMSLLPETLLLDLCFFSKAILLPTMILISLLEDSHRFHDLLQHKDLVFVWNRRSFLVFLISCIGMGELVLVASGINFTCPTVGAKCSYRLTWSGSGGGCSLTLSLLRLFVTLEPLKLQRRVLHLLITL